MMSFYEDEEGNRKKVDKETLMVLHDWVSFELIKLACFAEQSKIPVQVGYTLYKMMLEEMIDGIFGGIEGEN